MNLYRVGFYRNEMPESVLVVLAENEEQAKSFWPVSAERPAVACCYDGAVSTPMVTPGVVLKQGRWDDYSHPGLEFVSESARHTWNLTTGKTRVYFGYQAKQPSIIKLYLVYSDVATEDYVDAGIIVGATTPRRHSHIGTVINPESFRSVSYHLKPVWLRTSSVSKARS